MKNPTELFLSDLKIYHIHPIIISSLPWVTFTSPTINLGDLRSNSQYATLGGLRVRRLLAQKGGFPLSSARHVLFIIWDRAKSAQYHLPPKAHPKSCLRNSNSINHVYNSPSGPALSLWASFLCISVFTPKCAYTQESPFMVELKCYKVVLINPSSPACYHPFISLRREIVMRYIAIASHNGPGVRPLSHAIADVNQPISAIAISHRTGVLTLWHVLVPASNPICQGSAIGVSFASA